MTARKRRARRVNEEDESEEEEHEEKENDKQELSNLDGDCSTYLRLDTSTKCLKLFYTSQQPILG
jgi:hypothetical protein